jgi:hypothetical protein
MRIARICVECGSRAFGQPDWRCPHHPTKTKDQFNRPYFGRPRRQFRETPKR